MRIFFYQLLFRNTKVASKSNKNNSLLKEIVKGVTTFQKTRYHRDLTRIARFRVPGANHYTLEATFLEDTLRL